jgi:Ca2+-binding EF-hand superfamily protein
MRSLTKMLAVAAMTAALLPIAAVQAGEGDMDPSRFVKMCDTDKDGMVSKAEAMKMIEKAFDKADAKKQGKLDKKQVETFLKMLMQGEGS